MPDPTEAAYRAALEAARHTLVTLHGLWAHDGQPPDAPEQWQIDTTKTLAQIDAVLGLPPVPAPTPPAPAPMIRSVEETL